MIVYIFTGVFMLAMTVLLTIIIRDEVRASQRHRDWMARNARWPDRPQ